MIFRHLFGGIANSVIRFEMMQYRKLRRSFQNYLARLDNDSVQVDPRGHPESPESTPFKIPTA